MRHWRGAASAKMFWVALCCAGLTAAGAPSTVQASGFDVYGVGARGAAMASTGVTTSGDYSAVYYNPAGLVHSQSTAGLGLFLTFDQAAIHLSPRPAGYDVPDLGPNSPAVPGQYRLRQRRDFEDLETLVGLFIGATSDFGLEDFRIGVLALVPMEAVGSQQSTFNDEREQYFSNQLHFDLLDNRVHHQVVLIAVAYQPLDWLSLGVGLSFMPDTQSDNRVYLHDLTNQSEVDVNLDVRQESRWRPNAGLLLWPNGEFRTGLTFRDEQLFGFSSVTEVQVRGFQGTATYPFFQDLDLTLQFQPIQLVWGGSWSPPGLQLALDVSYAFWSDYPSHHRELAGFDDTVAPHLGAEMALTDDDLLRVGLAFEPTPVPAQTGRTNYVDNSRFVASAGMGHEVDIAGAHLRIGWHVQLHYLLPRTELKEAVDSPPACGEGVTVICDELPDDDIDPSTGERFPESAGLQTGNPGFPGFSSGGWLGAAGFEVSYEF